jgi:preprotein translocase subunit YajC
MPSRFFYAIAVIVVLSFFFNRRTKRQQAATWKGVVTDIRHQRTSITDDAARRDDDWVTILYRTEDGRDDKLKLRMKYYRQFFTGLKCGDRLVKKAGTFLPRIEGTEVTDPQTTEAA